MRTIISLEEVLLSSPHGAGVPVFGRDVGIRTDLDANDPLILQDISDEGPVLRVRLEYASEDGPARARQEVPDRRGVQRRLFLLLFLLLRVPRGRVRRGQRHVRNRALFAPALGRIRRVEIVRGLCDAPGELLEVQTVVDDPARPDVDQASIV